MNHINHLAILVCVIALFVLGFIWYGPLFGDSWMEMVGLDPEQVEANPPGAGVWLTNLVATVLPLYVLAWLLLKMDVKTGLKGAWIGFMVSFSFVFLSQMTGDMFAKAPYALSWITGGYSMLALTLSGLILGAWAKRPSSAAVA